MFYIPTSGHGEIITSNLNRNSVVAVSKCNMFR